MKSLYIFIIAITFSFSNTIYSQSNSLGGTNAVSYASFYNNIDSNINNADIKGTPYLNEAFTMATILPLNEKYPTRYNAVNDVIEVKLQDDSIIILNKKNLDYSVDLNNTIYKSFKYPSSKDGLGYFSLATNNDKVNIITRSTKNYYKAKPAANSYSAAKKAYFDEVKTTNFIYFTSTNTIKEFPKKTKHFIALFKGKEELVKKYIKQEKINLKQHTDAIKVINYINTL